jgi:hypothetical protein
MNAFLNFVSDAMIHMNQTTKEDGTVREFANVTFACDKSASGYANVAVNKGQLLDAKKKDGTVVDGYKTVLLGDTEKTHKVSICTKKATAKKPAQYETISMTNAEIKASFDEARAQYAASKKSAVDTEVATDAE